MLRGEPPLPPDTSVNVVTDTPKGLQDWIEKNAERIKKARKNGTLPYFLRDNEERVFEVQGKRAMKYGTAMKLGRSATKKAMKEVQDIGAPVLTDEQKQNIRELADALGIPRKQIKPMTYYDADHGVCNPSGDNDNCQSVVVAFAARRRGLDCVALPFSGKNKAQTELMEKFQNAFLTKDKKGNWRPIKPAVIKGKTDDEIVRKTLKQITQDGEYVLGINHKRKSWQKMADGHVVNLLRRNGKIYINDEQIKEYLKLESYEDLETMEIIRVDNAILNISLISNILRSF